MEGLTKPRAGATGAQVRAPLCRTCPWVPRHRPCRLGHTTTVRGNFRGSKTDRRSEIRSHSQREKVCPKERTVSQTAVYFLKAPAHQRPLRTTTHAAHSGGTALCTFLSTWSHRVQPEQLRISVSDGGSLFPDKKKVRSNRDNLWTVH